MLGSKRPLTGLLSVSASSVWRISVKPGQWNVCVLVWLTPQWYQICWSPQSWTRPCHPGPFVPQSRWWSGLELKSRLLIWSDPWSLLSPRMFRQPAGITVNVAFNLSGCKIPSICASEPVKILETFDNTDTLLSVWVCHMTSCLTTAICAVKIEHCRLIWLWIKADYMGLPARVTHSTPWLQFSNRKSLRSIKEKKKKTWEWKLHEFPKRSYVN